MEEKCKESLRRFMSNVMDVIVIVIFFIDKM